MDKLFIAIWVGHIQTAKLHQAESHPLEWFNDERGYDPDDIAILERMEAHQCYHIGHGHYVIRIK